MLGMMRHVVKISVGVSSFLLTPIDSVLLVGLFCSHNSLVTRTSRKKIEKFCFLFIVN